MSWSTQQHKLFEAAAHNPAVAKNAGILQAKAAQMASEGIAPLDNKKLGKALRGK